MKTKIYIRISYVHFLFRNKNNHYIELKTNILIKEEKVMIIGLLILLIGIILVTVGVITTVVACMNGKTPFWFSILMFLIGRISR